MKIEIRADGTAVITGYVNVVGRESRVLRDASGDFIEIIAPGTFARALEKNENVGLMFNHQRDVRASSLQLKEDSIGLFARAEINDSDIISEARDGKLTGWSFGFYLDADEWNTRSDGMRIRTVTDLDLVEVSMLDVTPAYIATSIEMRDGQQKLKECRSSAESEVEILDNEEKRNESEKTDNKAVEKLKMLRQKFNFEVNFI